MTTPQPTEQAVSAALAEALHAWIQRFGAPCHHYVIGNGLDAPPTPVLPCESEAEGLLRALTAAGWSLTRTGEVERCPECEHPIDQHHDYLDNCWVTWCNCPLWLTKARAALSEPGDGR